LWWYPWPAAVIILYRKWKVTEIKSTELRERLLKPSGFELFESRLESFETFRQNRSHDPTQSTILNTTTGAEITLPGYLQMNYGRDIRIERQISQGGAGIISVGHILSLEVKGKIGPVASGIVLIN